jgi:TRAP-type C4-dicarboxylate transport system permease small subunit
MSEKINKLASILLWVLMGLTVIFAILFYVGGAVSGTEGTRYEEPKVTNSFILFAYILLAITLVVTLFFSLRNLVQNPKGLRLSLVALGIGAILIGLAALLADNTVLNLPHYRGSDNVPRTLFWTDVGLFVAYFLLILAFLAIIFSVISRYFKK